MHHYAPVLFLFPVTLHNNDTIYLYKEIRGKEGVAPRFDVHKGEKMVLLPDLIAEVVENFPPTPIAHVVILHEARATLDQFNQLRSDGWLINNYEG